MNIPTKKLQNGFELPVYGLGLWQMGGRWQADNSQDDLEITAIRAAIDAGITHIDTAEVYGDGHAEELLARAIKGYDRSKLFIASKVAGPNQGYDGVMKAFEGTLSRLNTSYLDLYMLHRFPDPGLDIKGTMQALNELADQGLIMNIGVSNMTPGRFDEAQRHSHHKIVTNQVHYNVQYREIEKKGVLQHAQDTDVMIVAWRPLQKGLLPDSSLLNEIATKYGKTTSQIAINWLISQQNVVTIAKTSSAEHLHENLGALDFALTTEEIEQIRLEFPNQQSVSDAVPLDYEASFSA